MIGRGAGAGAAAHAGGDEDHVRAFEVRMDFVGGFLGGVHADFGVGAGAQALGDGLAQLDAAVGLGERQVLRVGVGDDELDPFEAGVDHVVDGVAACPADAEDDDTGLQFRGLRPHQRERHISFRPFRPCPLPSPMRNPRRFALVMSALRKHPICVKRRLPDSAESDASRPRISLTLTADSRSSRRRHANEKGRLSRAALSVSD